MHLYGFLVPPLIILDYLYVSRVKLSSFLYPLSIMTKKGGEIVENMWFLFKILHVRDRNTCHCKEEMCFILLEGVLTSFFLYTGLVTMFTYIVLIFDIYIYIYIKYMSSSPISTCVVSLLSLYTCFLYNVYNLLFLFHTKMPWWVLFKVFQKYRLSKSTCHKLSSCKFFQEFVLGYILLYLTNEYELSNLWLLSYVHLFVVVLS